MSTLPNSGKITKLILSTSLGYRDRCQVERYEVETDLYPGLPGVFHAHAQVRSSK